MFSCFATTREHRLHNLFYTIRNGLDRYGSGPQRDPKAPSFHIPDTTKPQVVVSVPGMVPVTVRRPEVLRIVVKAAAPDNLAVRLAQTQTRRGTLQGLDVTPPVREIRAGPGAVAPAPPRYN